MVISYSVRYEKAPSHSLHRLLIVFTPVELDAERYIGFKSGYYI